MKTVERWEHGMLTAYVVVSNGEIVCLYARSLQPTGG